MQSGGWLTGDEAPRQFGDYHLIERIAIGGMAEVWKARAFGMAGFEKTLVIKKVLDELARDEEFVRLFIDEARIAVQLQHVNIVQVFDLGQAEGSYFMAMEYVAGMDLDRLLARAREQGPVPIPIALFIVGEVLKALQFAHERRDERGQPLHVVHCDISPHNILVSNAGEVKITDFGISRAAFQSHALQEVVRGKYAYMSPEQVENRSLDGRSDVFSLGVVLWELLTGRRLFKAKTREETLQRVRRAEVPSPRTWRSEISPDLEDVVLKSLSRRPEERYPSAASMLEAIGVLMVREGHRANNQALADWQRHVIEPDSRRKAGEAPNATRVIVVAADGLGTRATPSTASLPDAIVAVAQAFVDAGGEIWEQEDSNVLAVWRVEDDLNRGVQRAMQAVEIARKRAGAEGFKLAVGVAPGRARIYDDTGRPAHGWELAGPFYLARWMMNLSAHRGRPVLTAVAGQQLGAGRTQVLGRIAVDENAHLVLHELR